jgi:hypothetical protein
MQGLQYQNGHKIHNCTGFRRVLKSTSFYDVKKSLSKVKYIWDIPLLLKVPVKSLDLMSHKRVRKFCRNPEELGKVSAVLFDVPETLARAVGKTEIQGMVEDIISYQEKSQNVT